MVEQDEADLLRRLLSLSEGERMRMLYAFSLLSPYDTIGMHKKVCGE
jgi:hypothetical protein